MRKSITSTLIALALAVMAAPVSAQTGMTCDDIDFASVVRDNYPDIDQACLGVVERNGELFAKTSVEVIRARGNNVTFKFQHPDGSFGPVQTAQLPPEWRAAIAGRNIRARDLVRGQQLNVYLPQDRWEAHVVSTEEDYAAAAATTYAATTMYDDTEEETMAALPSTASPLFAIGGAGGAAVLIGMLFGFLRRRMS